MAEEYIGYICEVWKMPRIQVLLVPWYTENNLKAWQCFGQGGYHAVTKLGAVIGRVLSLSHNSNLQSF